jgi:proteasome lid subunit RPN8/RPN11
MVPSRIVPSLLRPPAERPSVLTFSPLAWLKLQFFCHAGPTEIGGFGISSNEDLLYIEEFVTVRQQVSPVSVRFEDSSVADFFDRSVDRGLRPARFGRLWCHTHPGSSVTPSGTDEETFARSFGNCDWAVMFILGRTGATYARLIFTAGPGGTLLLPVVVDWSAWPDWLARQAGGLDRQVQAWQEEYHANVQILDEPFLFRPEESQEGRATLALAAGESPWWETEPHCPELDEIIYEPMYETLLEDDPPHEPQREPPF